MRGRVSVSPGLKVLVGAGVDGRAWPRWVIDVIDGGIVAM